MVSSSLNTNKIMNSSIQDDLIEITLDNIADRRSVIHVDKHTNILKLPVYTREDSCISGQLKLNFKKRPTKDTKVLIQLIGEIQTYHSLDKPESFLQHSQELEAPGKIKGEKIYKFSFPNFQMKYETYYGIAGSIRYYLRAVVTKKVTSVKRDYEFAVQLPITGMLFNYGYEIQLRIADYLMINVELNRSNYHVDDCVLGKITIEEIKLVIRKVQISVVKREIVNPTPALTFTKEDIVTKVELMNKCPKKGELIPFRINLSPLNLSPTMSTPNLKLSIKYMMILSFLDEEDRSLFKPIELNVWRKR